MGTKHVVMAFIIVILWGLNFVTLKIAVLSLPPIFLAGLRFFLISFPWIFFVKKPKDHCSLVTFNKGAIRGNHFHKESIQYSFVVSGKLVMLSARVNKNGDIIGKIKKEIEDAVLKAKESLESENVPEEESAIDKQKSEDDIKETKDDSKTIPEKELELVAEDKAASEGAQKEN